MLDQNVELSPTTTGTRYQAGSSHLQVTSVHDTSKGSSVVDGKKEGKEKQEVKDVKLPGVPDSALQFQLDWKYLRKHGPEHAHTHMHTRTHMHTHTHTHTHTQTHAYTHTCRSERNIQNYFQE